jgi:hypothetical protein
LQMIRRTKKMQHLKSIIKKCNQTFQKNKMNS